MDIKIIMDNYGLDIGEFFTIEGYRHLGMLSFINGLVPGDIVLVDSSNNCSQNTYTALGMLVSGGFKVVKTPQQPTIEQLNFIKEASRVIGIKFDGETREEAKMWISIHAGRYLDILKEVQYV